MTPFLQLALALAVILFSAKLGGYISTRLGQPSVLGELVIGILLGPSLINLTHLSFVTDAHLNELVTEIGQLGVLLLMFLAGLELHLSDIAANARTSALAGSLGVVFSIALGYLVARLAQVEAIPALFLGLATCSTSVSISAQTLIELKLLRSKVGMNLLGAAVFDDVITIMLLSIFLALTAVTGSLGQIAWVLLKMALFLALSVAFGLWGLPNLARKISPLPISQGILTFTLVVLLTYGLAAELIGGMAAITGTFLAGMMFARSPEKSRIESGLGSMAYGFFIPIFFVSIGLSVNLREITPGALVLMLGILAAAVLAKIAGVGLGGLLTGFNRREALQLGVGMITRGEVSLIALSLGLSRSLVDGRSYSAVIGMVLVTILITPPLLRGVFKQE